VDAWVFVGFLGLAVFCLRALFATGDPVAIHDLAPMSRLDQLLRVYDFPWDYKSNLGSPVMLTGNAVYNLPLLGLSVAVGSVILAHKVWLVLLMAGAGFGFYRAFQYIVGSRSAGLVASLYALFNSFTLVRWTYGHNTILLAYMVVPFALLLFFKAMREGGRRPVVGCGVLLGLLIAVNPHVAYLFILLMLLYVGVDLASGTKRVSRRRMGVRGTQLGFTLGIGLAVSFPLLYHIARVQLPVYSVWAEEAVLFIAPTELGVSLLPLIALAAFFTPALAYVWGKRGAHMFSSLSSLVKTQRQPILFFLVLGGVSVLLAVLALDPLKPVYYWLFEHIPGMAMFREVNKLLMLSALALAFFLGLMVTGLRDGVTWGSAALRTTMPIILPTLIILASSWQFLTGDLNGALGTVAIPAEYQELERWLAAEEEPFRIALFPPAVWATTYSWAPRWFLDPLVALQVKPTVEVKSEFDLTPAASLTRWVYTALYANRTSAWGRLLGVLGVRYVIVRPDADMPGDRLDLRDFSLEDTLAAWETQRDLDFQEQFGSLLVYRNPYPLPHLYATQAYSLIVGDRRMLLSLLQWGVDVGESPPLFLDEHGGSVAALRPAPGALFFQGDPYWSLLVAALEDECIVQPWRSAPLSTNPTDKWVKGDLMWSRFDGDLNVVTDGYVYTEGVNTLTLPVNVAEPGDYRVLAQVYDGLPGAYGIHFSIDDVIEYTFTPTRSSEGAYVWVEIGSVSLRDHNVLQISGLGGPAAMSKIALVPDAALNEVEDSMCTQLQGLDVPLSYVFDTHAWRFDSEALVVEAQASSGRLIDLSRSAAANGFYVFRDDVYTVELRLQARDEGARIRVLIDDQVEWVASVGGVQDSFIKLNMGSVELLRGYHDLRVEAMDGEVRLDVAVVGTGADEGAAASDHGLPTGLSYRMCSGAEYVVEGVNSSLVFLEGGGEYWRFYGSGTEVAPLRVWGYGSLFPLDGAGGQGTLRYLGRTYLEQGALIALTAIVCLALGLRRLGAQRFRLGGVEG